MIVNLLFIAMGLYLIGDGVISIKMRKDTDWWYQPGRYIRIIVGIIILIFGFLL